jgi:hypothetical protein
LPGRDPFEIVRMSIGRQANLRSAKTATPRIFEMQEADSYTD